MRNDEVNWITIHNCGKPNMPKWQLFTSSLSYKGKMFGLTLSHKMCPRKQITDLGIIFLWRRYIIHGCQLVHPHIVGSRSGFFWATPSRITP